MASLGGQEEPEPDMEHDPTLASCCQREIKDRRIKQGKLDAIRAGMPAAVCPVSPPPALPHARAEHARATPRRSLCQRQRATKCGERAHADQAGHERAPVRAPARAAVRGRLGSNPGSPQREKKCSVRLLTRPPLPGAPRRLQLVDKSLIRTVDAGCSPPSVFLPPCPFAGAHASASGRQDHRTSWWLTLPVCAAQTQNAGKPAHADVRAEYGAMTEEEIDAALNDDELDLELEQLRLSRLQQLRCRLCWRSARYAVCDRCHLLSSSCVCRQWGGCLPCGLFAAYHPLLLATGRVPRPPNAPARTIKTRAQGSSEAFLPPCLLSCSWTSPFQGSPSWRS